MLKAGDQENSDKGGSQEASLANIYAYYVAGEEESNPCMSPCPVS